MTKPSLVHMLNTLIDYLQFQFPKLFVAILIPLPNYLLVGPRDVGPRILILLKVHLSQY
jgi:hypothetical protein